MTSQYTRPMVGRERELALIMDCYKAARDGHALVVLVAGEPGIGKTRLLDKIATHAMQDGAIVLRGGASGAEGMPPYQPFLEALSRHIQVTPLEQLHEQITTMPQVLIDLLPELAVRLGDIPKAPPLPLEQARFRLYETVGAFLEAIGRPHILVLILDDLHWTDTASLDLLCHIARRQSNAHLLILGAYRASEIDQNRALGRTVAELSRQRVLTTVLLSPLSAKEIEELAIDHLGCSFSPEVSLLLQQCEGNPYFAEELLDGWITTGTIARENNTFVAILPTKSPLPPNLATVLQQQFMRLSPDVIDCLRVAATIGRKFDLSLLATVQKQEMEAVEDRLLVAKGAHLVQDGPMGSFRFSHDKIRECLYAEVSETRRKHLHGIIGDVLEAQYESEQTTSIYQFAELAFHYSHSSDGVHAIDYSLRTASQTLQTFAFEEAMSHYQVAIALLSLDDSRYGDIMLNLGEAALLAGKDEQAEMAYEKAQQWLEKYGNREVAARAAHGLGRARWRQEKRVEGYAALQQALELLEKRPCEETIEVLLDLAILLMVFMGSYEEGVAYAKQAEEMAHIVGDSRLKIMASRVLIGNLSLPSTNIPSVLQFLESLLTQAESSGDLTEAAECSLYLSCGYYWSAQIKRAHELSVSMIEFIKRSRQSFQLRHAYSWQALLLASQGKWKESEQSVALAYPIVDHLRSPLPFAFLCQIRGFLAYQQEDYSVAERELQAAMVGQDRRMSLGESTFYFGLLGLVQAVMGNREEAFVERTKLERRLELLPSGTPPVATILMCLALMALVLGEQERASILYSDLLAFQGQYYWFLVDRVLGMIAAANGEWEKALVHLAVAATTAQREDLKPELAHTLLTLANAEVGRGGRGSSLRARKLLNQSVECFEELGMTTSAHSALSRLQSLSGRPIDSQLLSLSTRHGLAYPADLTQHEVEVLKLLVEGKSNREIAEALNLAQKDSDDLLITIFLKTKTKTRAEAKDFAIRHVLA